MINKDLADKWIKALRSGDYPQTKFSLKKKLNDRLDDGFCCLGVLCEISNVGYWDEGTFGNYIYVTPSERIGGAIDHFDSVGKAIGLNSDQIGALIGMNDDGRSFDDIASEIENFMEVE